MNEQVPSIGRIVHFVYGDQHLPAIITEVSDGHTVSLTVFQPDAQPFTTDADYDAACASATWHWPERV